MHELHRRAVARRRAGSILPAALALVLAALAVTAARADLKSLVGEYQAAKDKLKGAQQKSRAEIARKEIAPRAVAIGKLDDAAGLKFLESELNGAPAEVAEACVAGIIANSSPDALSILFNGFARRPVGVRVAIVTGLTASKRSVAEAEAAILDVLRTEKHGEVARELPPLVARLSPVKAAMALIGAIKEEALGRGKPADDARAFNDAVVEVLRKATDEEVKRWLADDAFRRAPVARLQALLSIAAALKLEGARPHVIEALESSNENVAIEAVGALERIGIDGDAERVAALLARGKKMSLGLRIQILDALAASGEAAAVEAVIKSAKEGDTETRCIALGSLSRKPDHPGVPETLAAALADSAYEVRNAALRSLARVRWKGMVEALIAMVDKEKDDKLRVDALQLLVRLTGKNMGLQTEDWRKWWEVAAPAFEFSKESDGSTSVKAYDLEYFGIEVSSKRIAFVVDASSSMLETVPVRKRLDGEEGDGDKDGDGGRTRAPGGGDEKDGKDGKTTNERARKIDVLKKELSRVIAKLSADTSINIIYFHGNYSSWKKQLHPLAGPGRKQAIDFVQGLQNGTGTNVFDTLEFALEDKRVDTIFLLTDGMPTRGRFTDAPAILREIAVLNRVRGATINCIAFGEESELLKDLAAANSGAYRFVDSY